MQKTTTIRTKLDGFVGQIESELQTVATRAMDAKQQFTTSVQKAAVSARESLEISDQLREAWDSVKSRITGRLDFPQRQEMDQLRKEMATMRRRLTRLERLLPAPREAKTRRTTGRTKAKGSRSTRTSRKKSTARRTRAQPKR